MSVDAPKRSDTNKLYDAICGEPNGAIKDFDGKNIPSGETGKMHFYLMLETLSRLQSYVGNQIVKDMRAYVDEAAKRDHDNRNSGPNPYIVPSRPVFRFHRDRMFDVEWQPRNAWERKMLRQQERPET